MSEYITLQHATKFCPYTQEYLSLRARQGKLKALKLGRNWVCTKEWLQEYISQSGKPGFKQEKARLRAVDPPKNLPIYAPDAEMWEDEIPEDIARQKAFQYKFQGLVAVSIVLALFCGSIFQGRQEVSRVGERASSAIVSIAVSLQDETRIKGFSAGEKVQIFLGAASPPHKNWSIPEIMKNYVAWLAEQARNIIKGY